LAVTQRFRNHGIIDMLSRKAPTVETWLSVSNPSDGR